MKTLTGYQVYCGTYHKYNCGSLFGKWMDLCDYNDADEFFEACRELHKDEDDPELMFQDVDCPFQIFDGEPCCSEIRKFYELKDEVESTKDSSYDEDDLMYMLCNDIDPDTVAVCGDEDDYHEYLEECFCGHLASDPTWEHVSCYIDWEHVYREYGYVYYSAELPSGNTIWYYR